METKKASQKNLLDRVASGQLSTDDAYKLMFEADKPAAENKAKKPRGRPVGVTAKRSETVLAIAVIWMIFKDKMPKMKLRELISDRFCLEPSRVSKVIARLNKLEKAGCYIGLNIEGGTANVLLLSPADMAANQRGNLEISYRDYIPDNK